MDPVSEAWLSVGHLETPWLMHSMTEVHYFFVEISDLFNQMYLLDCIHSDLSECSQEESGPCLRGLGFCRTSKVKLIFDD